MGKDFEISHKIQNLNSGFSDHTFNVQKTYFIDALKISDAISQSIELLENENFKNYSVIDLRIHGKIVVE